jgi:hypothetical protein
MKSFPLLAFMIFSLSFKKKIVITKEAQPLQPLQNTIMTFSYQVIVGGSKGMLIG